MKLSLFKEWLLLWCVDPDDVQMTVINAFLVFVGVTCASLRPSSGCLVVSSGARMWLILREDAGVHTDGQRRNQLNCFLHHIFSEWGTCRVYSRLEECVMSQHRKKSFIIYIFFVDFVNTKRLKDELLLISTIKILNWPWTQFKVVVIYSDCGLLICSYDGHFTHTNYWKLLGLDKCKVKIIK